MNLDSAKRIFLEVYHIFLEHNIRFYISDGTVLGAVRDKGFIPCDFDIDSRMHAREWNPILLKDFGAHGFRCVKSINAPLYKDLASGYNLHKDGIEFGIGFNYFYPPDNLVVFLAGRPSDHGTVYSDRFYKEDNFIEFLGVPVRTPDPPEEYLELIYGADWRTPLTDNSWRRARKPISITKYVEYFHAHPEVNR